jgi:uncharacterized protein YdhG (YjbR/CyaY superfamily)
MDKYITIDEYIEQFPPEIREILINVRETIRENAPDAEERISWGMPTFWQGKNLIHFAAQKQHIGIYPGEDGVKAFESKLNEAGYKYSKGAIQFPYSRPIPYGLIAEITRSSVYTTSHLLQE